MNSFEDACWNVLDDYTNINDFDVSDFYVTLPSADATTGVSLNSDCSAEKSLKRTRDQEKTCFQTESKASRERLRREKMNDRFSELRKFLNPGSPAKSDKSSILHDAICAVYKLQSEHQELKQRKKKLQDDTLNLKEEKNELKEEKLNLQERKQRIEQQLKATTLAQSGYVPMQQAIHQGGRHKGVVVSGYGGYPMWQWIPPSVLDISKDHVLRPPVA
ncbi:transcription factor ILR3-like [Silene latifolia]|uniref:transcription factor ILR3-like n=1 Tax=Silene latifolia TaxID=37657 RepID=UPI003D7719BA